MFDLFQFSDPLTLAASVSAVRAVPLGDRRWEVVRVSYTTPKDD